MPTQARTSQPCSITEQTLTTAASEWSQSGAGSQRTDELVGHAWEVADDRGDKVAARLAAAQVKCHNVQPRHVRRRAEIGGTDVELELCDESGSRLWKVTIGGSAANMLQRTAP